MNKVFASFPFSRIPFTQSSALTLFLVISFPINFWALLIWFKNFGSIFQEEGMWGAIGVGAYMLTFALFESIVVFIAILAFSMLTPRKWGEQRTFVQISTVYLIFSIGLILQQSRALIELPRSGVLWSLLNFVNNMATSYLGVSLALGTAGVGSLLVWVHRSDKALEAATSILGRLVILASIYSVFNVVGIIIVIIRNL